MLRDWDYTEVQCFDQLKKIWNDTKATFKLKQEFGFGHQDILDTYTPELERLNMKPIEFNDAQSKFFKYQYARSEIKHGIMARE